MTGPSFSALFGWEARRIGRSPLLWTVLAALVASFVWGALTTASLHRRQSEAQARIVASQAAWLADVRERAVRYSRPAPAGSPELPTWQDPTDLAGFARFFLFTHSLKPHLPLSPLAIGDSDIAPSWLQVKVNTPFAGEPQYDFENPRGLAIGAFGLDFALVYLLPLALILLFGLLATFERDHGMLPLVAVQPVSPRRWLGARLGGILVWAVPTIVGGLVLALALAGAPLAAAMPPLFAALALVVAYILFWTALAAVVLAGWPGATGALGALTAIWAAIGFGLPLLVNLALSLGTPPPSRTAYVDTQRRVTDAVERDEDAIIADAVRRDPRFRGVDPTGINDLARFSFTLPETERRLAPARDVFERERVRQLRIAGAAGYVAPPLGMAMAFARLAGTDDARQLRFEARTRAFQRDLRGYLYGIAQQQITAPVAYSADKSRGRLNFTGYDRLPRYAPVADPSDVGRSVAFCGWLLALGAALLAVAALRTRTWPRVG